jgi:hypothetical protein
MASLALLGALIAETNCKSGAESTLSAPPPIGVSIPSEFQPVELPDPHVKGFVFPESASTLEGWARGGNEGALARHAWGLWTALMMNSGQSFEGQPLRTFDTWFTMSDLEGAVPVGIRARRTPHPLWDLARLAKARRARRAGAAASLSAGLLAPSQSDRASASPESGPVAVVGIGESEILGNVKFSPEAAEHIGQNELISVARLTSLLNVDGQTDVPAFPSRSVVIKALYRIFAIGPDGTSIAPRFQSLPSWSGPPDPPTAYAPARWPSCVWVDTLDQGTGTGTGAVDSVCKSDGSSRTPASTYGLGSFVYFMMTPAGLVYDATLAEADSIRPRVGDAVILVGMHVTTRETPGWTWETFWWSPTPDAPLLPSSSTFAAARPPELTGAARSYVGCSVLSMQMPPEPLTGGAGNGESVYCYNPWLEAHFSSADLVDSVPGTFEGKSVRNDVGVESNCMSCHAQAAFGPSGVPTPNYTGDRYVDVAGAEFAGTIRTDFLWSVADIAE